MGKLTFTYACMGAGKTTQMLTMFDQYKRRKKKPLIIKPCMDVREGTFAGWGITKSRITKNEEPAYYYKDLREELTNLDFGVLFVDEAQFLSRNDVITLCEVCDSWNKDVFCFGLKTDVTGNLFEGSKHLLALADDIIEIPSICEIEDCGCKAVAHIRYIDGVRETDGKSVAIETGNVTYKSVCRKHWILK
jgi:thymidine kinase